MSIHLHLFIFLFSLYIALPLTLFTLFVAQNGFQLCPHTVNTLHLLCSLAVLELFTNLAHSPYIPRDTYILAVPSKLKSKFGNVFKLLGIQSILGVHASFGSSFNGSENASAGFLDEFDHLRWGYGFRNDRKVLSKDLENAVSLQLPKSVDSSAWSHVGDEIVVKRECTEGEPLYKLEEEWRVDKGCFAGHEVFKSSTVNLDDSRSCRI